MRSTLTLVTTWTEDQAGAEQISSVLTLGGDPAAREAVIAMHSDALVTIAQMQARLCGIKTDSETLDMDGRRVY